MRDELLRRLKTKIASLEGQAAPDTTLCDGGKNAAQIADDQFHFGIETIDGAFTHKIMPLFCLHEIRSTSRQAGAASGFLLAMLAQLSKRRSGPLIWITTHTTLSETGELYGPGLHIMGHDPERLLIVQTAKEKDALWAAEEALTLSDTLCVVLNLPSKAKGLSLAATRRLHLRAEKNRIPLFMLLAGSDPPAPSIALTRWQVAALPAGDMNGFSDGIAHPAFHATLIRNRQGKTGHFTLQWNHHHGQFEPTTHQSNGIMSPHTTTQQSSARDDNSKAVSGAVVSLSRHRSSGAA